MEALEEAHKEALERAQNEALAALEGLLEEAQTEALSWGRMEALKALEGLKVLQALAAFWSCRQSVQPVRIDPTQVPSENHRREVHYPLGHGVG